MLINKLGIILINYNSNNELFYTIEILNSKNNTTNFDILVVDNNSSKKNELNERLKNINNVKLIFNEINAGFAGGVNKGLSYGIDKYEHFLIMNIDIDFKDSIIDNIISILPNLEYDLAGCRILNGDGDKNLYTGGHLTNIYISGKHYTDINPNSNHINFITGCFMLVNSALINKIGMFDPYYFMYCEDTDFCYRAYKVKSRFLILKDIIIYHHQSKIAKNSFSYKNNEGTTPPYVVYFSFRNRFYINKKYRKGIKLFFSNIFVMVYLSKNLFFYLIRGRKRKLKFLFWAIIDGIRGKSEYEKYVVTK